MTGKTTSFVSSDLKKTFDIESLKHLRDMTTNKSSFLIQQCFKNIRKRILHIILILTVNVKYHDVKYLENVVGK